MSTRQPIGIFERYLSVWVASCIVAGIGLGSLFPGVFETVAGLEYGSVNFVVAILMPARIARQHPKAPRQGT